MKKLILLVAFAACLYGCGYSSVKNELTGQVKKVAHQTPLICPNYTVVDVSLGVMRNGTGSISGQDMWLTVEDKGNEAKLKSAADSGAPVRITYDVKRVTWCVENYFVSGVEMLK